MKRSRSRGRAWSGLPGAMYVLSAPSVAAVTRCAEVFPNALAYAIWIIGLDYFGVVCAPNFLYLVPAIG